MKPITTLAIALVLSLAIPGIALADSNHGHGAPTATDGSPTQNPDQANMMQEMMRMMMPMMMQMHGQMMGGATQGSDQGNRMAMMDSSMMRMMMGGDMMSAASPEGMQSTMLSRLAEFDADGDGSLSLSEFEALHAAMTRETTVDRFQHLDADGDGQITKSEMAAPVKRMKMQEMMTTPPAMRSDQKPLKN